MLKKYCQYDVQQYFENNSKIHFITSQLEADIMIGSVIQKINDRENTTVFSTDCDMFVVAYGCIFQNFVEMYDTAAFFELFGLTTRDEVAAVPEYCGCDYTNGSHLFELIHKKEFIYDSMIYTVFRHPE